LKAGAVFSAMPSFEATIFDMDGVIIDSEPRHERAFREIFAAMGYGETHGIDFTQYYGRSDKTLWIDFIEKHRPAQPLDYLMSWKQQVFLEMIRQEEPIFETLPELVERLASTYRLGLASGSYHPVIEAVPRQTCP
jgi:beta-phosphoglucomutase